MQAEPDQRPLRQQLTGSSPADWEHRLPVEVFISDTDSYAIIYHTVYHKYFERATVEMLGVAELERLAREEGVGLREIETRHIRFFDSGLLGDLCTVVTTIAELSSATVVLEHKFMRDSDNKMLTRAVCEVGFVQRCVGAEAKAGAGPGEALASIPPGLLCGSTAADTTQHVPRTAVSSIFGGAPKPYDWLAGTGADGKMVPPFVWGTTAYMDTVDASGEVSHPNILDMFERCRSAGLGGAVVLKQRAEEAGNAFVVGRIDRVQYSTEDVARFGDRLEVRAVVELKYRKAGILFHQSLWRPDGQRPLAWGCVTVYSIDKATKQPCPVSPEVEASLAAQLIAPPK